MIGDRSGRRRRALGDVEAVHHGRRFVDPAVRGEVPSVTNGTRALEQEVGVEGHDHVGARQVVARRVRRAERGGETASRVVAADRVPAVPGRARIVGEQLGDERRLGRAGDRSGQQTQARALLGRLRGHRGRERSAEALPARDASELGDRLRAIGVVEVEHRRLGDRVGGAEARRMLRVALHLGRPSLVALGQDAGRIAADHRRGREEERPSGHDLLGLLDVGNDLLERLARAGGQAGEPERGRREPKEVAAGDAFGPLGRESGKLAMQHLFELRRAGDLLETAPEARASARGEPFAHGGEVDRRRREGRRFLPLDVAVRFGLGCDGARSFAHPDPQRWQVEQEVLLLTL